MLGPRDQIERLVQLGVPELAGVSADAFRKLGAELTDGLVVVPPSLVPASLLAPLLSREGKPGFVVVDLTDLGEFGPIEGVAIPESLYTLQDVERGDQMRNWSPDEALPAITSSGRRPLTISEGICWLLQEPGRLEPNFGFMTIASRRRKATGLDARTPAIWISGGTGRDGRESKGAPKVGWCWAGNRHTWLGFAAALDLERSA